MSRATQTWTVICVINSRPRFLVPVNRTRNLWFVWELSCLMACFFLFLQICVRFDKIRLDPASGLVQRDDFQFSKTEGNPVRYGRAGDCYSAASKCHKGKFFIDLTGTGLRMRKEVEWEAWGTPKLPKRLVNVRKSQDGLTAIGECGGSCGGCEPIHEKMLLEPSTCTDASSTGMY